LIQQRGLRLQKYKERDKGGQKVKHQLNLQNNILNHVRKEEITVVVYLMNGFQIKGEVIGFDNFTIILKSKEKEQMLYKHAISTIAPQENIKDMLQKTLAE
jgi:host factor-I protein